METDKKNGKTTSNEKSALAFVAGEYARLKDENESLRRRCEMDEALLKAEGDRYLEVLGLLKDNGILNDKEKQK